MRIKLFYHSILSDWNHGNAHFLRGIYTELLERGHEVKVFEPGNGWSLSNLWETHGEAPLKELADYYPRIDTDFYDPDEFEPAELFDEADLVIVHEWTDRHIVQKLGEYKREKGFPLLFHDTHHRALSQPEALEQLDLSEYDGVLCYGNAISDLYLQNKWVDKVWTWHEAADTQVFYPMSHREYDGDLVWIGNWGDDERNEELRKFLIEPVRELGLKAKIYGVRYPEEALKELEEAGIEYGGYLPNYKVPEVFSRYKATVHIPRKIYAKELHGIPTIRPFEAMASGIPLISAPWKDTENLFRPGKDYLTATSGEEMKIQLQRLLEERELAQQMAQNAVQTIRQRHTCHHRVNELMNICEELDVRTEQVRNISTADLFR